MEKVTFKVFLHQTSWPAINGTNLLGTEEGYVYYPVKVEETMEYLGIFNDLPGVSSVEVIYD